MRTLVGRTISIRSLAAASALAIILMAGAGQAWALTYVSGDVLYVAYQSPTGPNYIVDLGSRTAIVDATTTISFPDVSATDLNGILGASGTNIFIALFGVLNPSTRDGIVAANGPVNDVDLSTANVIGAVNQIDSFGNGVMNFSLAVPSANPRAGKFASSGSTGSYQSTLNASNVGSLGNNVAWNVETQFSNGTGVRIATPVKIPFYKAIRNTFTGTMSRGVIGFFTLNTNGTVTYSPDADGDLVADDIDLCPGVYSPDNSDVDGDGHAPACDCNPLDGTAWALPGEATALTFTTGTNYNWTAPASPGGTVWTYDVLRATQTATGTPATYACFQNNLAGLSSSDATGPSLGQAFFYVARAGNSCGEGLAGTYTNGQPVPAPACP